MQLYLSYIRIFTIMWSIIHFLDENTVETVPSKWFSKNKCAWPNNKSKRHIADQSDPIPQYFKWFKARALLTNIESFSDANKKCKTALVTSDLSSAETENVQINFKNKKKSKEMLQFNSTKHNKIKCTVYDDDKFSDIDTADDEDCKKVLKMPTYESDDGTSTKEIVEEMIEELNNKGLKSNQLSSPSNFINKTHSKNELPSKTHHELEITPKLFAKTHNSPLSLPKKTTETKSPKKRFSQMFNDQYLIDESDKSELKRMSPDLILRSPVGFSPSAKTVDRHNISANSMIYQTNKKKRSPFKTPEKNETVRKQLFVNSSSPYKAYKLSNVKKRSPIKTSTLKAKKYLSDEQFKEFMQHNVILLKHNMRNLDEKVTMLLEQTKKNDSFINDTNNKVTIDYSHLDCFFPICDETTLISIEEQLLLDKIYNSELINKLIGLGGKTVKIFVKRIMQFLFTDNLLKLYSFHGRGNKKKCFSTLAISKVIFNSVKCLKKIQSETINEEIEQFIKYALIQAPFNIKKKETNKSM